MCLPRLGGGRKLSEARGRSKGRAVKQRGNRQTYSALSAALRRLQLWDVNLTLPPTHTVRLLWSFFFFNAPFPGGGLRLGPTETHTHISTLTHTDAHVHRSSSAPHQGNGLDLALPIWSELRGNLHGGGGGREGGRQRMMQH